ncbi:serine-rich adhesin for platelets isoform X1 [Tachysurus ichikawai]
MEALVRVVWSVALLMHTAESSASVPVASTVSPNDAADLSVASRTTDPKEPIRMDLSRPPSAPQQISSTSTDRDKARDASASSTQAYAKITASNEPDTDATIRTDIVWPQESVASPKMSTNAREGYLDITPPLIPLRSTTITPLSPIHSSNKLSEEHQNSSRSTTSETIPTIPPSIPPPIPLSSLKDLITGSASLEKENQDGPSELDVGDEDSDKVLSPSPLDPLLVGLISIFIISTALLSIILFLKFRQQSGHPEFHRLQDLPMDDLLEDTPLSRYSY